jgi:hypothetical protein
MRPIRVFMRISRTDSVPCAGSHVTGHLNTEAIGHGAKVRMNSSGCGWMLRVQFSASVSAFVTVTVRSACAIGACHWFFSRADTVSAKRAAIRRDGVVTCHPSVPVAGSAQGARRPPGPPPPFVPSSLVPPIRADTREGGTKGRSLTVAAFGGAGTPPAPADLVGAAFADEVAQVPVKRGARQSGNVHKIADFPSVLGRVAQRCP